MDSDFALGLAAVTLAVDVCNTEILCWKNGIIHDTWISSLNQTWKISGLCFPIAVFKSLITNYFLIKCWCKMYILLEHLWNVRVLVYSHKLDQKGWALRLYPGWLL